MRRQLAAGLVGIVLSGVLAGCSSGSPEAELQSRSNDVVSAANAGDASALRTAASRMLEEIKKQNDAGDLTTSKANRLRVLLTRLVANAGDLEPTESPSPEPSPSIESPSPEPSPSPSPAESPSSAPSPEPSPPPSPDVVPSVLTSPAVVQQPARASSEPSPS